MTWSPLQPGGLGWSGPRHRIRCGTFSLLNDRVAISSGAPREL